VTSRASWLSRPRWRDGPDNRIEDRVRGRICKALGTPGRWRRPRRGCSRARDAGWRCASARRCDRGNVYCQSCAPVARRERVKRAGAQYQQSEPGRTNHKRRQQEYLARGEARGKMTHRGSPGPRAAGHSPPRSADEPRKRARPPLHPLPSDPDQLRCDFCGREVRDAPSRGVAHGRRGARRGPRLPGGRVRRLRRGRGS
jgi:hypothetical protein